MTLPVGLERLYFVGLAAPRGPQLPVYSAQARLIAKFLTAQERADRAVGALRARLAPEARIDIPRHEWQRDMARAHRRIDRVLRRAPGRGARAPRRGRAADRWRSTDDARGSRAGRRSSPAAPAARARPTAAGSPRRAPPSSWATSSSDEGEAHADALRAAGHAAHFLRLDVTAPADWGAAVETAEARFGRLDMLVNNAGVVRVAPIVEETDDGWQTHHGRQRHRRLLRHARRHPRAAPRRRRLDHQHRVDLRARRRSRLRRLHRQQGRRDRHDQGRRARARRTRRSA